jgi:hypothetical protein
MHTLDSNNCSQFGWNSAVPHKSLIFPEPTNTEERHGKFGMVFSVNWIHTATEIDDGDLEAHVSRPQCRLSPVCSVQNRKSVPAVLYLPSTLAIRQARYLL